MFDLYFRPRGFERSGRLYRWLGVRVFKRELMKYVRVDSAGALSNAYLLTGRRPADIESFELRTRRSEMIHLCGLTFAVAFLALGIVGSRIMFIPAAILFIANFHCFILQRFNRARMLRVLDRATRSTRTVGS
jgi:hypothetical protein